MSRSIRTHRRFPRSGIARVSRAMVSRYSHVRMGAKRRALDWIATRQRPGEVVARDVLMRCHVVREELAHYPMPGASPFLIEGCNM